MERSYIIHSLVIASLMMVTIFTGITLFTGDAKAASVSVTITLEPPEQWLDFHEGRGSMVTFTGSVAVNISGVGASQTEVWIELRTWTDNSWSAAVSPTAMTFSYLNPPQNFTVNVEAPNQLTDGQAFESIYIVGQVTEMAMGKVVAEYEAGYASGTIRISQFYAMSAWTSEGLLKSPTGTTAIFNIEVNNLGNGLDRAYVEGVDVTPQPDVSFLYSYFPDEVDVEPQTSTTITIHIDIPDELPDPITSVSG